MGVELDRIEFRRQPLVRRRRNRLVLHHPFAGAELGVDAPMNEHPKAGVTEPFARGQSLGGYCGRLRSCDAQRGEQYDDGGRELQQWR